MGIALSHQGKHMPRINFMGLVSRSIIYLHGDLHIDKVSVTASITSRCQREPAGLAGPAAGPSQSWANHMVVHVFTVDLLDGFNDLYHSNHRCHETSCMGALVAQGLTNQDEGDQLGCG